MGEAEEYDPFAEPEDAQEEEPPAASADDAAARDEAGGGSEASAPAEKIVMKLDVGKKKAKVAAVFDVGRTARSEPRPGPASPHAPRALAGCWHPVTAVSALCLVRSAGDGRPPRLGRRRERRGAGRL